MGIVNLVCINKSCQSNVHIKVSTSASGDYEIKRNRFKAFFDLSSPSFGLVSGELLSTDFYEICGSLTGYIEHRCTNIIQPLDAKKKKFREILKRKFIEVKDREMAFDRARREYITLHGSEEEELICGTKASQFKNLFDYIKQRTA